MTKLGIRPCLSWAATTMQITLSALHRASSATTSHRSLPALVGLGSSAVPPYELVRPSIAISTLEPRSGLSLISDAHPDYFSRRSSGSARDSLLPSADSNPFARPTDEMKRHRQYGPGQASTNRSPPSPSGHQMYESNRSPLQTHTIGRSLPSPPGMFAVSNISSLEGSSGPSNMHSAHSSHLQDLQHQISTKTLALQTLQQEHDQLLAAFSRSQIRCNALDKKSQVSDHEINSLTEEKVRLQQQVEALEAQVEELNHSREALQKQSTADGAQWRQIMAMSSQLQMKSAEETKNHKAAQDGWDREREELQSRIRDLETKVAETSPSRIAGSPHPTQESSDDGDVLDCTSVERLKGEIRRLRRHCSGLEATMRDVTGETEQLDQAMKAMANVRARLSGEMRP